MSRYAQRSDADPEDEVPLPEYWSYPISLPSGLTLKMDYCSWCGAAVMANHLHDAWHYVDEQRKP